MPFPEPLSLADDFSSAAVESDVEKCREEGARTRPGVAGFCVCAAEGCAVAVVVEWEEEVVVVLVVESRRGWEWLEK
jgi:hypothetical protein